MNFGPPRAQLCVDNSVLESVQVLTINSQIKVIRFLTKNIPW